jgi:hypothetical protein
MIPFESQEAERRCKDFLSRWQWLIEKYYSEHRESIIEARREYTWHGDRDSLERCIKQTLAENDGVVTLQVFEEVEYWGFGVKTISKHNEHGTVLRKTKSAFTYLKQGKLREAALELDNLPYVGPARATKLLALSNQAIYGIYDARASNALRQVNFLAGKIIMPVLLGRTIQGTGGDSALGFESFTWALRFMLCKLSTECDECKTWRVADVEMSLFVLGHA